MNRAKFGLDLITLDIKAAKSRQRLRLKQNRTQAKAIDDELYFINPALKVLRECIKRLEKLEKREAEQRKIRRNEGGRNSMVGTYGK